MRVIVAGGTGFIGSALVRALQTRGDQVVVLSRKGPDAGSSALPGIEMLEWHPPEIGAWAEAFNSVDAVINVAGRTVVDPLVPWTSAEKRRILASRVEPTEAIVRAIAQASAKPEVLINQSAIGYYGSHGDRILTEESGNGSDFLAGVVRQWESAAQPVT
ncbi:MAG: NAD-dependent epimerase/dehydratase family protein, partial [Chloroflexota bacterium]